MTFEEYFDSLKPSDIWQYELQVDLANEACNYLNKYNEIIDTELTDFIPYKFTMNHIAETTEELLQSLNTSHVWDLSPDTRGGVFAVYTGTDFNIFTLEFKENKSVVIEYILNGEFNVKVFSFEVPFELITKEINKLLDKVKVVEELEENE